MVVMKIKTVFMFFEIFFKILFKGVIKFLDFLIEIF